MWIAVAWLGYPLWDRFLFLQQQGEVSARKLTRLQELAQRKPTIEQAYARYAEYLSDQSDEAIQGAFLDELEQLARTGNLDVSLKPLPVQRQGDVRRLGVEVEVGATQDALLNFLDRVFAWPALVEVVRLRISTTVSKERPLRALLVLNRVVLLP